MDYESVSSIVIVAMLVIVMVGWLPKRTVDSMKRVIEHREDRFSSSLHLVDQTSGTQFSDVHGHIREGAAMQHTQERDGGVSAQRIATIRRMRREAARRRRILVIALSIGTLVVAAAAAIAPFSWWYVLIPLVLLVTVLGLGIRASRHAMQWERDLAANNRVPRTGAARRKAQISSPASVADQPADRSAAQSTAHSTAADLEIREDRQEHNREERGTHATPQNDDLPTGVMEQREIRRALKQTRDERDEAVARRSQHTAHDGASTDHGRQQPVELVVEHTTHDEPEDATNELGQIRPSHALEAFDMASQPDLISFSLGAAHAHEPIRAAEPESLEIKSTRQVAKAQPLQGKESAKESVQQPVAKSAKEPVKQPAKQPVKESVKQPAKQFVKESVKDASAFHQREVESDVEVPEQTSDSLGADLQAVLARRSS